MRARPALLAAAAMAVVGAVVLVGALVGGPDPYPALRQRSVQEIPGTLGMVLAPPRATSVIPPEEARGAMGPIPDDVPLVLVAVSDPLEGLAADPVWVAVARGLCLRDSKGELVSDARGADPGDGLECTDATFQVIAVDAVTGRVVLSTTGYDPTLSWAPDVGSAG